MRCRSGSVDRERGEERGVLGALKIERERE